jgi:hypothetical protein
MAVEIRKSRLEKLKILFDAMRGWLDDNGYSRKQSVVRFFRDRWYLYQRVEEFQVKPPGRFRFFWFLVRESHAHVPKQAWKLTAFNYVSASAALVLAYKDPQVFYRWRGRMLEALERFLRRFSGTNSGSDSKRAARI